MPLPVSGAISFNAINVELGVAGTTQASLNQASYRTLAGVPSGAISMSNFYGKANQFAFTISSNQTNANLRTLALNAGWNGTVKVVATISSGIYCSSNTTGTPGLTVNGSFPGGVELVNDGFIIGMGGAGGRGARGSGLPEGGPGAAGGLALSVSSAISIRNNGTIGGGGGGGGGGQARQRTDVYGVVDAVAGGGGGGGRSGAATNSSGGPGGVGSGSEGGSPGGSGTTVSAGSGGAGGTIFFGSGGSGGTGGGWGSAGSAGNNGSGGSVRGGPFSGGAAGAAITGNSNITYLATGTRLGAIT